MAFFYPKLRTLLYTIDAKNLGSTVFAEFVLPFVNFIRSLVGIQAIYIYALPEDKLIKHYKTMGFHRLDPED